MNQTNRPWIIIAIDGLSASGKGTLARQLARKLNFNYVDSGAIYRALTCHFIRNNARLENPDDLRALLSSADISFRCINDRERVFLNSDDVSEEIRSMDISQKVSEISKHTFIREHLIVFQRGFGLRGNVVMDGRDIGTTIFPHANIKLYMTASIDVRSKRRYDEIKKYNPSITLSEITDNLIKRDLDDTTRLNSPLKPAHDAIYIDSSALTADEVLEEAMEIIKKLVIF